MSPKDEIKKAKQRFVELRKAGLTFSETVKALNLEFEGFYFTVGDIVYRENERDYLPSSKIN